MLEGNPGSPYICRLLLIYILFCYGFKVWLICYLEWCGFAPFDIAATPILLYDYCGASGFDIISNSDIIS